VNRRPDRLRIEIGGHFGPSFSVDLQDASVTYTQAKRRQKDPFQLGSSEEWETKTEQIRPTPERWAAFRAALDELNVWSWHAKYGDPEVCDGTGWSAKIVYSDKAVSSHGSNCFPDQNGKPISIVNWTKDDTFEQFCRAVSLLIGRAFK
jgi:hypothetical protein